MKTPIYQDLKFTHCEKYERVTQYHFNVKKKERND